MWPPAAGLDWPVALLLGAILSPTDPVFAAAIVGRADMPLRLRRLLNVESGLNDGLALPFVLIFLATAAHEQSHLGTVAIELVGGLALRVEPPDNLPCGAPDRDNEVVSPRDRDRSSG